MLRRWSGVADPKLYLQRIIYLDVLYLWTMYFLRFASGLHEKGNFEKTWSYSHICIYFGFIMHNNIHSKSMK